MVKLYASLLSLTLTTSLALAAPHPSYTDGLDYFEDLAAREPNFWGSIKHAFRDVGRVAVKGLQIARKVTENPLVQAAISVIPGGSAIVAAQKVVSVIGEAKKYSNIAEKAINVAQKVNKIGHLGLGGPLGKVKSFNSAISRVGQIASAHKPILRRIAGHRRDLEDSEELSLRDLDEELFEREYDDFLAERDYFDNLD